MALNSLLRAGKNVGGRGLWTPDAASLEDEWTPAELSPALWLDAGALTGADNSSVSTWPDGSGSGHNATQATGTAQPTLRKTRQTRGFLSVDDHVDVVTFDGGDWLSIPDAAALEPGAFSVLMIAGGLRSTTAFGGLFDKWASSTGWMLELSSTGHHPRINVGAAALASSASILGHDLTMIEAESDGTNGKVWMRGAQTAAGALPTASIANAQPMTINGDGASTNRPAVQIAELLVVPNTLTATQRANLYAYIERKYGIVTPGRATHVAAYNGRAQAASSPYYLGVAFSRDRINWTKSGRNPVLTPGGGWEGTSALHAPAIIDDGTNLKMYAAGLASKWQIGLFISTDGGVTWQRNVGHVSPVLSFGAAGAWDEGGVYFPQVLYDPDDADASRRYKMWYVGLNASGKGRIGYAYSSDGITWTKYASNPVLGFGAASAWDQDGVFPRKVVRHSGSSWSLFYFGNAAPQTDPANYKIGRATFTTPESSYARSASNPLLSPRTTAGSTLTASTAVGDTTLAVTSSAAFVVNEYVIVYAAASQPQVLRIKAIPNGTTLTLTGRVRGVYTTGNGAAVASMAKGNVTGFDDLVELPDGSLLGSVTVFTAVSGLPKEIQLWARSASGDLDGPWDFDWTRDGPLLADEQAAWDEASAENMSVVAL